MGGQVKQENWMNQIAELCDEEESLAPSCLKSKLYSRLIEAQQLDGPLLSLKETEANGRGLCVFEKLIEILPAEKNMQSFQGERCQIDCAVLSFQEGADEPQVHA